MCTSVHSLTFGSGVQVTERQGAVKSYVAVNPMYDRCDC